VKASFVALALAAAAAALLAAPAHSDEPTPPIVRGGHISKFVKVHAARKHWKKKSRAEPGACSTPGGGNFVTVCAGGLMPVNEPAIATNGSQFVAGANDYNSYNGQGQNGFYWSSDGVTWNDDGPLDLFPHDPNSAAGDPGVAIDGAGVVYYSSIYFNRNHCDVGGVELARRDPATGSWTYRQLAANSEEDFQDKPAIAIGGGKVFVSWSHFGACDGEDVPSPIEVAVLPAGAASVAPSAVLAVPGSTYSQGSSVAADGSGGFWVAWEEFPEPESTAGEIRLAHHTAAGWEPWRAISPPGFHDLPNPLPGFRFRIDSFPALVLVGGQPWVAWASADGGVGRVRLWAGGPDAPAVAPSGGDQFFPAIAADGSGGAFVSYGQTAPGGTYDWYLAHGPSVTRVSQRSSTPNDDLFFSGQFIGDYSGLAVRDGKPYPIWTAVTPGGFLPLMQTMVFAGGRTTVGPGAPALAAPAAGNGLLRLHWTAPADDGGAPITAYNVYRGTASGGETLLGTTGGTSYDDTSVVAGTLYWYRVSAVNAAGEGALSNEVSAPADLTLPIVAGGGPVAVTTTLAGENARLPFSAAGGDQVSVLLTGSTVPGGTVSLLGPDGTTLASRPFASGTWFIDRTTLPAGGTSTILVDPAGPGVGTVTVTLYAVPSDASATLAVGGSPASVAATVPGQNARLTFAGSAGEGVGLQLTGVTVLSGTVSLLRPDGTTLVSKPFSTSGITLDRTELPATGMYTILVDPSSYVTGAVTATVYDITADVTATIVPGGPAVQVTTTSAGQNARVTFTGSVGENVALDVSGVTITSGTVSLLRPDGTTLTIRSFGTGGVFVDPVRLPVAGTYTLLLDPTGTAVGTARLRLFDVPPDVSGTISAGGAPVPVTTTAPGQNARLSFVGSAGGRVSVQLTGVTVASGTVSVLRPDGTPLVLRSFTTSGTFVDPVQLPASGTYTVLIDPTGAAVGAATASLFDVPPDVAGSIVAGGAPVTVTVASPGQTARLSFDGTAGRSVTATVSGVTIPGGLLQILRPGGVPVAVASFTTTGGTVRATLPADGTYTVLVDPTNAAVGSATVTLT
jgi:hypothetical protein